VEANVILLAGTKCMTQFGIDDSVGGCTMRVLKPGTAVMALWLIGMVSTLLGQTRHPIELADSIALGVQADGKTDATAAIQKALDATGKQGGVVRLPAGKFLVAGSLKIPVGVALVGSNQAPVYIEPLIGTVILGTGGRDRPRADRLLPRSEA
jgi:hypothetical protein